MANMLLERAILRYVEEHGAAYFTELWLEFETHRRPLERALAALTKRHQLMVRVEPGAYPNRVRYELLGPALPMRTLPRARYWEADFGPPTRDAELNLVEDLRKAAFHRQAEALLGLAPEPKLASVVLGAGIEHDAIQDLCNVGLPVSGLDLERREHTYRLSGLGRVIQQDLARARRN